MQAEHTEIVIDRNVKVQNIQQLYNIVSRQ